MQVDQRQDAPRPGLSVNVNGNVNLLKRSRSTSPSANKRRAPSSYSPAMYSPLPAHLHRTLSTSSSGVSSPHDWVARTNELHLATPTPPPGSPDAESYFGQDVREFEPMDADEEHHPPPDALAYYHQHQQNMHSHPHPHSHQHHSLPPSPAFRGSPFASHHSTPPPPAPPSSPVPPHRLPPLYDNIAGSPNSQSLSRSSSGTDASMSDHPMDPREVRLPTSPQRRPRSHPGPAFSMGFRADCDKCVARVPGHYSHVM